MKHLFPLFLLAIAGTAMAKQPAPQSSQSVEVPNIVYILADDMGPGDVTAYNMDSKIPTPHLDRLAAEGMIFMDSHTSSGVCTPTRYGILTGRYSWRTWKKEGVLQGHSEHLIDPARETVASMLKKIGYVTACFGKWHLGMDWHSADGKEIRSSKPTNVDFQKPIQNGPLDLGFDKYFGISASLNMDPHAFIEDRHIQGTLEFLKDMDAVKARGYIGAKPGWAAKEFEQDQVLGTITRQTCEWIRENSNKPFFVYMPLNSPHSPIVPSRDFAGKSGLNDHGDFCMETDWSVGAVMKTLKEEGIVENTIVIFTADNGTSPKAGFGVMAEKGHHSSWIYRGMKGTNWEGGHRTPFIVRWPAQVKAGSVSNELICTTDFMATCADLLGIKLEDSIAEDSVSFLPALMNKRIPGNDKRLIIHHSDKGIFSVRSGKWKVMFDDFGGSNRGDARKDDPIINAAPLQLFDMSTDSIEKVNLAAEHPEVIERMKQELADIIRKGRSTPGKEQPTDLKDSGLKWPQLEVIEQYMNLQTDNARPNVLFIAIDDLNTCPDPFSGETTVHTPNIDRLARMGTTFTNAHCAAPACNPSRASVMTGVAPFTSGVYSNNQDWRDNAMLKGVVTIPGHFRENGYKTLGGGKLYHASSLNKGAYTGYLDPRPWDQYFPSKQRQMPEEVKPEKIPMHSNKSFYGGHFDWAALDIETDEMADAKVVAWAEQQLSKAHDKPLFLAVGIYRPHIPWWTPEEYFDRHPLAKIELPEVPENDLDDVPEAGRKMRKQGWHKWLVENGKWEQAVQGYYASVSFTDDMIGRLLDALEAGPLADNTVVVLWSDHGYHLGQKEHWEKFALWEQTTRVPLIFAAPGRFETGTFSAQAVSLLDLYPTLSELCGMKAPKHLDGESLVPLMKNPQMQTGRAVISTQGFQNHAVRSDKWRYIRYADGSEELYDQVKDPKNFHNLAQLEQHAAIKKKLAKWLPEEDAPKDPTQNSQAKWRKEK